MNNFFRLLAFASLVFGAVSMSAQQVYEVPLYNNTYVNSPKFRHARHQISDINIDKGGLHMSKDVQTTASSYFYLTAKQTPEVSIVAQGKGAVEIQFGGLTKTVKINSPKEKLYKVGGVITQDVDGYVKYTFRLTSANGDVTISKFSLKGLTEKPIFLSPEYSNHFGLRGPSCHLNYSAANKFDGEVDWAKIDITVPEDLDQMGSYYMALGFSYGYFGFQNNAPGRRMVLFSVWNSEDADNPDDVAKDNCTEVIRTGEGVTAQNFGHEGSGKQSFIRMDWKPGQTYSFLLHAERADATHTDYSAWFYDSVNDKWYFMSTLRRPKTTDLIKGLHSFLENFNPEMGDITRKAYYHNGWAKTVDGDWQPILRAMMTNDATAREGVRLDFNGGVEDGRFFLTNGGYFNRPKEVNRRFMVDGSANTKPELNLQMFLDYLK